MSRYQPAPATPPIRRTLALLVLVYSFNFLDRQILSILAVPIKAEMALTDTQLGALSGLAFALFYTGLGIPAGRLADRHGRARVIAGSLALWSGFTALCGLATGFWSLFLCRLGVGVGEAGGTAPSYALVADSVPAERRGRALAIYSFGVPIGSALGLLLGGVVAEAVSWRMAFAVVGLAGLVAAPLVALLLRDPPRAPGPAPATLGATLALLVRLPSFWLLSLGASSASVIGYGIAFWLPSLLARRFDWSTATIGQLLGPFTLVTGIVGIWASGWLADRLAAARPAAYPLVPAFALLLCVPLYAWGITIDALEWALPLLAVPSALALTWLAPVQAALQTLVPPAMRATAAACFLFVNNLVGLGMGTLVIGWLSDRFGSLEQSLLAGLAFYPLAALLLALAARRLPHDRVA